MRGRAWLVAAVLGGCGGAPPEAAVPAEPTVVEAGRAVYLRQCASCHGRDGAGVLNAGVPLTDSRVAQGESGALLRHLVHEVGRPAPRRAWPSPMPSFANLDDTSLAAVAVYVRQELAGRPGLVTPAQAAAAR